MATANKLTELQNVGSHEIKLKDDPNPQSISQMVHGDGRVSDGAPSKSFVRRLSLIADNKTIKRRESQVYLHKRQQTLKKLFKDGMKVEQDGMALNSLKDDHVSLIEQKSGGSRRPVSSPQKQKQKSKSPQNTVSPQSIQINTGSDQQIKKQQPSDDENESPDNHDINSFEPSLIKHVITAVIIIIVAAVGFYWYYDPHDRDYYYMTYPILMAFVLLLFLYLNYANTFYAFHEFFSSMCNGKGPPIFVVLCLVCGIVQWILWTLYENGFLSANVEFELRIVIDVTYYGALLFLFFSFMSYWPTLSYYCSEKTWVQALLYMSILGYILIWVSRQLHPPAKRNAWHRIHPIHVLIEALCWIVGLGFFFCVILTGVGLAAISEAVQELAWLGTGFAFGGYIFISFCVMLAPLAPGSIVDVTGGFLIIYVLQVNEFFDFWEAWAIGVVVVVALHYCGACAQWYIGTWPCVQHYANRTFPPELLAASDAVLEDANFVEVGIIGYVFMDTMNGLNQGRINMEFWTQLFSEWSCIPNALSLVSLGGTIAVPLVNPDSDISQLLDVTVPLLAMVAFLVQFTGSTIGVRELGKSLDTDEYMMSREKWATVQFFSGVGYVPSKLGWENDVYQLSKPNSSYPSDCQSSLYQTILPLQRWYVRETAGVDSKVQLNKYEQYRDALALIRNRHYLNTEQQYDDLLDKGWLIEQDSQSQPPSFFDPSYLDKSKCRRVTHMIVAIILLLSFWACFSGIYWQVSLADAVEFGFGILSGIEWYYWCAMGIFIFTYLFYSHVALIYLIKSMGKTIKFLFCCCNIDPDMESRFKTPSYNAKDFVYTYAFDPKNPLKKYGGNIDSIIEEDENNNNENNTEYTKTKNNTNNKMTNNLKKTRIAAKSHSLTQSDAEIPTGTPLSYRLSEVIEIRSP